MDQNIPETPPLLETSRRLAQRLLATGSNRAELAMVEAHEAREHLLRAVILGVASAILMIFAGMCLTGAVALLLWPVMGPVWSLALLAVLYIIAAAVAYSRFQGIQREWKWFPASVDQLRKDGEWLAKKLT